MELLSVLFGYVVTHVGCRIIELHLLILQADDLIDTVLQSESENGHKESLLIPDQIPHGRFPCKIQMLPDNSDPLQKNPLPLLRCCRTHQLCRFCCQLFVAGCDRSDQCAGNCDSRSLECIAHMVRYQDRRQMLIQDHISINNDKRQDLFPDQYPKDTSSQRCYQRISDVFSCDRSFSITESLHRSDLYTLFLYHSCHRCQTDQCCHQEKEYREHFSNRTHAVCIISVSLIFRQCILSRLHIPLRIFDFFDLSLCVCNLLLCIRQLLLSICNLCLSVRDLFFRFFCCLLIFTPAIRKLLFTGCKLCFTCI